MNVRMKFDMSRLQKAIRDLEPVVKKSRKGLVEQAAKGFVGNIVLITPPASKNATGSAAKKAGETTITNDLAKVMMAVRLRKGVEIQLAQDIYQRFRDKRTGRINPRNLHQPYRVSSADYNALRKVLLANVGWLASGWNAAAQRLGLKVPAWIARHGTSNGIILITSDGQRFRIEVSNGVKFVGNVKDLDRRIQKAVDYQANAMQRQADYLLRKAVKQAGF